jgi:hypothetical protein
MKFSNAYELNLYLYKNGLIEGVDLGVRGEYKVQTKVADPNLLKILNETWGDWRWGENSEGNNALKEGFYDLYLEKDGSLGMNVTIHEDLLDFFGNPFDIEELLAIPLETLSLDSIDIDDDLEYQLCLNIDLENQDVEGKVYQISGFNIKSYSKGDDIDKELSKKPDENALLEIKENILDYLLSVHKKNHSYKGFTLKIEDNYFSNYYGTGQSKVKDLRSFLEKQTVDIEIDTINLTL